MRAAVAHGQPFARRQVEYGTAVLLLRLDEQEYPRVAVELPRVQSLARD